MKIKVKMITTLSVDPDEYPVPSDGNLGAEIEDYITDIIHEVDGLTIKNMKIVTEEY
jgi:hypothetical protein